MRAAFLALVLEVARCGVGAQESQECPRTKPLEVKDESKNSDMGLIMLQVSQEAKSAVRGTADVEKRHVEADGSELLIAGNHHTHEHTNHEHQAKTKSEQQADGHNSQLQKVHDREQHMVDDEQKAAPITMGSCFSSQYGYVIYFLVLLIIGLLVGLHFQYKSNAKLGAKIRGLRARLRADRYLIKTDERKLRAEKELLREEQKRLIATIHERGNIFFDPELRQIVLKRSIPFEPVVRLEGVHMWQTLARFTDPPGALLVLSDVAEVCQILPYACFLIEGHTLQGGSLDEIDEFAHEVADARALLVKETMMAFGVPTDRLEALGLPGALGNNRAEVLLKLVN